jgi:peptidoglycan/xylan/chitin deacetylase (PgdA/CDA1 family)
MVFIDLHYENPKETESLEMLLEKEVPFALSLTPTQTAQYPLKVLDLLREAAQRNNIVIGHQGKTHWCLHTKKHRIIDPCHENFCFYNKITRNEQEKIMRDGKELLANLLEREPELYVPPNHLYDENTIKIADKLNYGFFADNGIVMHEPYKRFGLIILPESESPKRRIIYLHNDSLPKNFPEIIEKAEDFRNIGAHISRPSDYIDNAFVEYGKFKLNTFFKHARKRLRDLKRIIQHRDDYAYETSPAADHEKF